MLCAGDPSRLGDVFGELFDVRLALTPEELKAKHWQPDSQAHQGQ